MHCLWICFRVSGEGLGQEIWGKKLRRRHRGRTSSQNGVYAHHLPRLANGCAVWECYARMLVCMDGCVRETDLLLLVSLTRTWWMPHLVREGEDSILYRLLSRLRRESLGANGGQLNIHGIF